MRVCVYGVHAHTHTHIFEKSEKNGVRRKARDQGSWMPRKGLTREGMARCCREVKERAEQGQEAATGFGNMVCLGDLVSGFLGRGAVWSFE